MSIDTRGSTILDTLGEPWLPVRFSPSLSGTEDFPSHGDWLLRLVDLVWRLPSGAPMELDVWQRWLLRHILETYPPGHKRAGELRYRQVVVSVGRQNGKSVLWAILGLYGLVREAGGLVIGIASSAEQARIIYTRVLSVIMGNANLRARFERLTDTRGIKSKDGGLYEIKAAKSGAVQGLDVSVGLADELHLLKRALWSDLVNGTAARRNGLVAGITTAGDDQSELLKDLYKVIEDGPGERFGFFVWEAPEAKVPDDEAVLRAYLAAANPAIACGRLDLDTVISDILGMPETDIIRYRLNRFVASKASFISAAMWGAVQRAPDAALPAGRLVFAVDRAPDWGYATITANVKDGEGVTHTEVVASMVRPTLERLVVACVQLARHAPALYVVDSLGLKDLAAELKRRGMPVRTATQGDVMNASALLYAKIAQRRLLHAGDPLLSAQVPRAVRKNIGEGFRISRADSAAGIDGVMATALGVFGAEVDVAPSNQLFT